MKIIALRHGEKDQNGNLTSHGREMSQKVGVGIRFLHNPIAVSSTTPRVRDTVSAVLEGNGNSDTSIRLRKHLSIDGFSPEFNFRWESESKKQKQEDVMQDFLNGKWGTITPKKEAQKFIRKLIYILGYFDKKDGQGMSDVVAGFHGTAIESILITLFGEDVSDNWKTPINFSEHALLDIQKGEKGNPILVVQYRDNTRKITLAEMRNIYLELY
ncbi:histidine phosphatase family protein [Candidatus Gracilibacteria bacterium]|nr:histidine phosphatase family protein [Candidatus Gracilibacteria bacterium]